MITFAEKLQLAMTCTDSLLCVGLDPDVRHVPERFQSSPDPILAWNQAIIAGTREFAAAYKPNIAFYEAMGRRGYDLLSETLQAIPPEVPVILDAKRGDIGTSSDAYARAAYDIWGADAVTVAPYMGGDSLEPFFARPEKGVFVLCHTSNPGSKEFQRLQVNGRALYEIVAEEATAWNRNGNVGLVVGATYPEQLRTVRSIVPDMWMLVPGVGAQGGDLQASLSAGLTAHGDGVLISASRSLAQAPDIAAAAAEMHAAIRAARHSAPAFDGGVDAEIERLALALYSTGCVQFGNFTLHSGRQSPIYIDLRLLVSDPEALNLAAQAYSRLLRPLVFERIAGIPYAALPIATAVSMVVGKPMIYPRKEVKSYGTGRSVEGYYKVGDRVVVLDDLITNGDSKLDAIAPLTAAGLQAHDIVVLIDREQGGRDQLAERGYQLHSVMGIRTLLGILGRQGRITQEQQAQVLDFLAAA